jgi:glutathione S-transferase
MAPSAEEAAHAAHEQTSGALAGVPNITFYTSYICPYAHRISITLEELGLQYEKVQIGLTAPRPQWYLNINPRGLIPSLKYNKEVLTESLIVSQFLADSHPSALLPATQADATAPIRRARIAFFIDTWATKVASQQFTIMTSDAHGSERDRLTVEWAKAVEDHIEPLLEDASPFFGGSQDFTFADAMAAPFVLRWEALSTDGTLIPKVFWEKLSALPHFSRWAYAIRARPSVIDTFNGSTVVENSQKMVERRKAAGAKH